MKRNHKKLLPAAAGAFALAAAAGFGVFTASAQASLVRLELREPGLAVEDEKLLVAVELSNTGDITAADINVTGITLSSQQLLNPAKLPVALGEIPPSSKTLLQLAFDRRGMTPGAQYKLKLRGSFVASRTSQVLEVERTISLPEPAQGERTAGFTTVQAMSVTNGNFTPNHAGANFKGLNKFENRLPLPEGKLIGSRAPLNPQVNIVRPDRTSSAKKPAFDGAQLGLQGAANQPVTFVRGGINSQGGLDTSGASVDVPSRFGLGEPTRLVFQVGNLYALLSTDGGATSTRLDPTAIFGPPPSKGYFSDMGWCCDQNVIYIPSINRIVWQTLSRGWQIGIDDKGRPYNGYNRLRVATATPEQVIASGGKSWRFWDMSTETFGFGPTAFLDYPDLTFTDNFLHISVSRVGAGQGGLFVIRIPLSDVQDGPFIHIGFTSPDDSKKAEGGRLTHDSPDAAYWFGHVTTSQLRIFEWPDNANGYTWQTIWIDSWNKIESPDGFEGISPTPNIYNWLHANIASVRGATFQGTFATTFGGIPATGRRILIAWNAGRSLFPSGFPHPYVRLLPVIKREHAFGSDWASEASLQLWNPEFAFHHAHLATNSNGEVGVSVAVGGGSVEATPVAGFLGEPLYVFNESNTSDDRWGDYTSIRRHWPNTKLFSVSDYFIKGASGWIPKTYNHQYRLFGRTADVGDTQ